MEGARGIGPSSTSFSCEKSKSTDIEEMQRILLSVKFSESTFVDNGWFLGLVIFFEATGTSALKGFEVEIALEAEIVRPALSEEISTR